MTSPLPPRRRDTTTLADLLRQDRTNLRQLDPGLMGGRFSPTKPPEPFLEDDEEGDDDDGNLDLIRFENTDTVILATDGGTPVIPLTYVPEVGSEQVYWDGDALQRSDWTRTDTAVTIPAETYFKAGEPFWIDYAYYDEAAPVRSRLDGLVLRGVTIGTGALPDETQAGDFVVIATRDTTATFSDPRFPLLPTPDTESRVYAGIATNLSTLAPSGPGGIQVVAAFVGGASVDADTLVYDTDPAHPSVPVQAGMAAIAVITERSSFVGGSISLPNSPPWLLAGTHATSPGWGQVSICYWFDADATTTPAVTPNTSGGVDHCEAFLFAVVGPLDD